MRRTRYLQRCAERCQHPSSPFPIPPTRACSPQDKLERMERERVRKEEQRRKEEATAETRRFEDKCVDLCPLQLAQLETGFCRCSQTRDQKSDTAFGSSKRVGAGSDCCSPVFPRCPTHRERSWRRQEDERAREREKEKERLRDLRRMREEHLERDTQEDAGASDSEELRRRVERRRRDQRGREARGCVMTRKAFLLVALRSCALPTLSVTLVTCIFQDRQRQPPTVPRLSGA